MAYNNFDWKPAFLAALREMPVLRAGCEAASVHRDTVLKARHADPEFDKAVVEAMEAGVDKAEQEAFRRAMIGFEEPVIHQGVLSLRYQHDAEGQPLLDAQGRPVPLRDAQGQPVALTVRKHSDSLLSLVLKARRASYRVERTEISGPDGGPVAVADATQRAARAATLLKLAQARKALDDISDLV